VNMVPRLWVTKNSYQTQTNGAVAVPGGKTYQHGLVRAKNSCYKNERERTPRQKWKLRLRVCATLPHTCRKRTMRD